jgi:serine/threonine protein phosphatase PrpC
MDQSINQSEPAQVLPPLPVGATIGKHLIVRLLSSGPEGNTYLTRSPSVDTGYQIIEYPAGEARALASLASLRLEHPALLAPREALTIGERAYIILPAPHDAQPIGPLPPAAALHTIITIGEALAYLHSQGIAHLRIQPASILVADEQPYLSNLEESQNVRPGTDDAQLLFERDANFLALTLAALTVAGSSPRLEQAIDKIREQGISHSYQSVEQVIADCQQAVAQGHPATHSGTQLAVPALTVQAGHATSVGRVRTNNEDALGNLAMTIRDGQGQPCLVACFVVADGMGGEALGELASQIAVRCILDQALRRLALPTVQRAESDDAPDWSGGTERMEHERHMREALAEGFRTANQEIRALTLARGQAIGTTATALLISGRQAFIGHAGDSRVYRLSSGILTALTEDHSYVQRLIQLGQIDPANHANHPKRNALYRALGQRDTLEIDIVACPLEPGDRFLLCSDGLWDTLPESILTSLLGSQEQWTSPTAIATRLVELADEAGGQDNSTAVVVEIENE